MFKKIGSTFISSIIFLLLISSSATANNPRRINEGLVIKSLQTILSAQATFNATAGSGNYGTNLDLLEAELIDSVLANGDKYGYYFVFSRTTRTATEPSRFTVTATPQRYGRTGKISFYLDESGELRGADKNGGTATNNDPFVDWCASYESERCTISNLRTLHSAQMTYQSTAGNGNFGSFAQLRKANLINGRLASGTLSGYDFSYEYTNQSGNFPASFKLYAIPVNYGTSGTRSFYISTNGILRGADKNGQRADETDPPLDF